MAEQGFENKVTDFLSANGVAYKCYQYDYAASKVWFFQICVLSTCFVLYLLPRLQSLHRVHVQLLHPAKLA